MIRTAAIFRRAPFLLLASVFLLSCGRGGITIMVYNVENLFDDRHDGTEFNEFDPSRGTWNQEFFEQRIDSIAEVVRKAVPGGPDLLALQEVENDNALARLVSDGLRGLGYTSAILVEKKGSATNTGIVSRLPVSRVHSHHVDRWNEGALRDIVEIEVEKSGRTLHLFNNHWKSKTGGARETEPSRLAAARVVGRRLREILQADPEAEIVVTGDMNESSDEYLRAMRRYQTGLIPLSEPSPPEYSLSSLFLTGTEGETGMRSGRLVLFDPWLETGIEERGSYFYGTQWQTFDHALLSPGLLDSEGFSYRRGSFRVFDEAFLLTEKGAPRKWTGLKGQRGFSDHLPLLLTLDVREGQGTQRE